MIKCYNYEDNFDDYRKREFMKNIKVNIKGTQIDVEGEKNIIELITEGKFYKKNESYYIVYDESEISGMEGSTTTLKIEDGKISMKRFGSNNSKLVFEKGKKHRSIYETQYGNMDMEVMTSNLDVNILDEGKGNIDLTYRMNISDMVEVYNTLSIKIM